MGKKFTALAAAVVLVVVGYYIAQQKTEQKPISEEAPPEISSPSDAIPSIEGVSAYMLMEVDDTRSLRDALSLPPGFIDKIVKLPLPEGIPGVDARKIAETIDFFVKIRDLANASDAMAVCVTSADVPGFYISMFVDDEKFDPLIKSGDRQWARTEEWAEREGDGEAWILRPDAPGADALYVTRRHVGETSVVNISSGEEAIDAMTKAAADPSKRLNIERRTEGPNFIRIKMDEPALMEGRKLSETELSWNLSDERVSIRLFSDMFSGISDRITSGDFAPKAPPVMGNGELAIFVSMDPMFLIYTILPNEDDPAKAFFERYGKGIPAQFAGDLEAIIRQCRMSAAVVTSGDTVCTEYLVIDTAAEGVLDRLYGMANLFFGGGKELEGWDSVMNVPTGTPVAAIVARRGSTVLFGAGDFEEYGYSSEIPENLEMTTSKSNALGIMAVPSHLKADEGFITNILKSGAEAFLDRLPGIAELGDTANFDRIDHFTLTQEMDGRINIDIYVR